MKDCVICGQPIHPIRIEAQPRAVTCGRACSEFRKTNNRAAARRAYKDRQKALHGPQPGADTKPAH